MQKYMGKERKKNLRERERVIVKLSASIAKNVYIPRQLYSLMRYQYQLRKVKGFEPDSGAKGLGYY